MRAKLSRAWPYLKAGLALAIVAAVGRRFALDLRGHPELWERPLRPGWLAAAGMLYLTGLGFSALTWDRLMRMLGQRPSLAMALRAYYIGHMGKYLPGKAWALLLRAGLARGPGVRAGLAGLTAFYEVLVTMAAGVLLAALLFLVLLPSAGNASPWETLRGLLAGRPGDGAVLDRFTGVALALLLLAPLLLPILPPVFNRLAHHLSLPFRAAGAALPELPGRALPVGLALTAVGWACLGTSLWCVLRAVWPGELAWDLARWGRLTGIVGVAYVAGFIILVAPGGLGVREFLLEVLLVAELAGTAGGADAAGSVRPVVVLAVLVLRLVWTVAEVIMIGVVWWLPGPTELPEAAPGATPETAPGGAPETAATGGGEAT